MRTKNPNSQTKIRLLDVAQDLVLSKGFAATSVDEICRRAKVTKGSFFHYFDSKNMLGQALLERFCANAENMHRSFTGSEKDPLRRVYKYLDGLAEMAKDPCFSKGCLLGTFSQELCSVSPKMQSSCQKGFEEWGSQFGSLLKLAKDQYGKNKSIDPKSLAAHLIAVVEGSLILAKAKKDTHVFSDNIKHYKEYVRSLFGG